MQGRRKAAVSAGFSILGIAALCLMSYPVGHTGAEAVTNERHAEVGELDPFFREMRTMLEANRLDHSIVSFCGTIEKEWSGDPFGEAVCIESSLEDEESDSNDDTVREPSAGGPSGEIAVTSAGVEYTGYLSAGDRRFAIIDGREYAVGDRLVDEPFTVMTILPDSVIIQGCGTLNHETEITVPHAGIAAVGSCPEERTEQP